ncbi:MAG: hypothetical protein OEM02_06995 [Desulfobulbaceae bacterium]|nr:hypothetical protein [Desulfobulbaceae bacterium]
MLKRHHPRFFFFLHVFSFFAAFHLGDEPHDPLPSAGTVFALLGEEAVDLRFGMIDNSKVGRDNSFDKQQKVNGNVCRKK